MTFYGGDIWIPDKAVHEIIWEKLQSNGNEIAIVDASREGMTITYKELLDNSRKCATYLQGVGIKKGEYISMLASNSLEFVYVMIGIIGSGAVLAPCTVCFQEYEMLHELGTTQPRAIFVDEEEIGRIEAVKEKLPFLEHIFVIGKSKRYVTMDEILAAENSDPPRKVDIDPKNDFAAAEYSSGTTGLPKCMSTTHGAMILTLQSKFYMSGGLFYTDRSMDHPSGFMCVLSHLLTRRKIIMEREFSLHLIFKNIEKYKVNVATCYPASVIEMINAIDEDKYDLSSLKTIICAGAPIPPAAIAQMITKYRVTVLVGYAMNETGIVSVGPVTGADLIGAAGKIQPGVKVKIVDLETRKECGYGSAGEICIRSPQATKGYLNNTRATEALFDDDGWLMTGDIGSIDKYGNLRITDRLKELIKYKGAPISPPELESIIIQHPKVADVGVVGIPDEECGEVPRAFVVPADRTLAVQEVHDMINSNLADFKQLRGGIEFVSFIPKSAIGKIQRRQLRKLAAI